MQNGGGISTAISFPALMTAPNRSMKPWKWPKWPSMMASPTSSGRLTPNGEFRFDPGLIRQRRDELQSRLGDRLKLATGCDFHLSSDNLEDIRTNTTKYTINQKGYLLVEFADFAIPPSADDTLRQLQRLGLSPIITHPERNRLIRSQPDRLRRWLSQGCYVQVTAQSLLGRWGEGTKKHVGEWLDQKMVHFFASDATMDLSGARCGSVKPMKLSPRDGANRWHSRCFTQTRLQRLRGVPCRTSPSSPKAAGSASRTGHRKRFFFF